MRTRTLFPLTICLALVACNREPPHPKGVPAEAFWVGPPKTGVFLQVGSPVDTGWNMTLYDRKTGQVKIKGVYLLQGFGRAEITQEDVDSWDGHQFLLKDGGRLVPRS
jgi:hypothetical protein